LEDYQQFFTSLKIKILKFFDIIYRNLSRPRQCCRLLSSGHPATLVSHGFATSDQIKWI